jgi:DNA invertase Pin-like site-specific DNA recombinase
MTGSKFERKGLDKALVYILQGDTLVEWKLERLAQSLQHLIATLSDLQERDIDFISLTEKVDTTTPGRKLIFPLMDALAEFEHDLIGERTTASLTAARA